MIDRIKPEAIQNHTAINVKGKIKKNENIL
jgi:hypothetical protein